MARRAISQAEREAMSARKKAWWAVPENREHIAQKQRERIRNDPVYRESTLNAIHSLESRQKSAAAMRAIWSDPVKRAEGSPLQAEKARKSWANPEQYERRVAAMQRGNATPQAKANRGAASRLAHARKAGLPDETKQVVKRRTIDLERLPMDPMEAAFFGGCR